MAAEKARSLDAMFRMRVGPFRWHRLGSMPVSAVLRGNKLTFDMDVPGVKKDDVDVTVNGNVLEVKAHRRVPDAEHGTRILDERHFGDWHRQVRLVSEGVKLLRFRVADGVLTVTVQVDNAPTQSGERAAEMLIEEPVLESDALYDSLVESAALQVELAEHVRRTTESSRRDTVSLTTPTGKLNYTLPLTRDETYSSTDAGKILSPEGQSYRSTAQSRRKANELLGVKVANRYRHPKFQFDLDRRNIIDVVMHANSRLESHADPWGALDWWYSEDEALDDQRPVDMLERGELTTQLVDFAIDSSQQSME
ncbi:Hsp20/alpha crystallin family protein [Mycobacterium sp. SMC-19]|uniref:Hsp20/alpha crystallin family protein n=1 Tax=Mycobacterium sp. SMC-19 TaxID=3381630 RepID=UPI003875D91A